MSVFPMLQIAEELHNRKMNCVFKTRELFPLKQYKFGAFYVMGAKNPRPFLTRCYGQSWPKIGYITQDIHHGLLEEPQKVPVKRFVPGREFYKPRVKQLKCRRA